MVGNANGLDLNNDSLQKLSRMGGIGLPLAMRIVNHRPFRRWEDLKNVEGFDEELVADLRGSGAKLGKPTPAAIKKAVKRRASARELPRNPDVKDEISARGSRKRRIRNLFSGHGIIRD